MELLDTVVKVETRKPIEKKTTSVLRARFARSSLCISLGATSKEDEKESNYLPLNSTLQSTE